MRRKMIKKITRKKKRIKNQRKNLFGIQDFEKL
jgi:hypothetical protein